MLVQAKDGIELRPVFRCMRALLLICDEHTQARVDGTVEAVAFYITENKQVRHMSQGFVGKNACLPFVMLVMTYVFP